MIIASKKKQRNGKNLNYEVANPIFCSEHLTHKSTQIMIAAKKLRQEAIIKFIWSKNGAVKF